MATADESGQRDGRRAARGLNQAGQEAVRTVAIEGLRRGVVESSALRRRLLIPIAEAGISVEAAVETPSLAGLAAEGGLVLIRGLVSPALVGRWRSSGHIAALDLHVDHSLALVQVDEDFADGLEQ